jgi:hypothetical protein
MRDSTSSISMAPGSRMRTSRERSSEPVRRAVRRSFPRHRGIPLLECVLLVAFLFPTFAGAESRRAPEGGAATHLDHLASALEDLRSDKPEVRRQGIGRLVFYQWDVVANGILVEHWFAETDHSNRLEILRGLLRNGTLTEVVADFRNSATRFAAPERYVRLEELADILPAKR